MDLTRKAGLGLALLTVAGLAATAPVQAAPSSALYSTGVDAMGASLPNGTVGDLHYTLVSVPSGSTTTLIRTSAGGFPIPPYLGDNPTSTWIGPDNDLQLNGPAGLYDYQTFFTVAPGQNSVSGLWATDNEGAAILLNGQDTGNSIPYGSDPNFSFQHYTSFTITGLHSGPNQVDFIVHNVDGPTALRVDGLKGGTVAPEPSSFAVFGFLGLGMAGLMLKARKRSTASATA